VSLQVERVVETLAAERAQVSLDVAVAPNVASKQSLQREDFLAGSTLELVVGCLQN
jgi:hypothetical protein